MVLLLLCDGNWYLFQEDVQYRNATNDWKWWTRREFGAVISGAMVVVTSTMMSAASSPSNSQIQPMKLFAAPMPLFACPCGGSQVVALVPYLHFITVIINEQPLSLTTSLLPIDPQPRVLKIGWNLSLIFIADILSSGFCWWAPKVLSCGSKLVHVGLKPLSFSLG